MKSSLRRRLVLTMLVGGMIGGLIGIFGLYWQAVEELNELFDDRLQAIGNNLAPGSLGPRETRNADEIEDDIVIQLWAGDGSLLYPSTSDDPAPIPTAAGLMTLNSPTEDWRSYSRAMPGGGWLQVAQEQSARRRIAVNTTLRLLLPLLSVLPLLALFSWLAISRLLRPLRTLADQLQRGGPHKQVRVVVDDAPSELGPVIEALNDLLARQADAARRQQAFLADAAHELRTPLTVVGLQVQRAQQASNAAERSDALTALKSGVDRAIRMVTQLLALARSEPGASPERPLRTLNLESLLTTVLAELYPLAANKHIDLGLVASQPCLIDSEGEGLRSLITNLVDNAIRHTPAGGRVDVSLQVDATQASLLISDTGCGIAADRRQAVFERFVREGEADASGTGLGLAIVRQEVDRHHGSIVLEDGTSGIGHAVRVLLPLADPTHVARVSSKR